MNALLRSSALTLAALLVLSAGCADDKKKENADADAGVDPGAQKKPVLGGKLGAAVKAAESAQAAQPAKGGGDGPPESGVFAAGLADKAQAAGAPPKVEVIAEGNAPRFQLAVAPMDEQRETVSVTVRLQSGAIPTEFGLALKIDKPKDDKKGDAAAPAGWRVAGKVATVGLPPQVARDLGDKLAKLKGAEIRYTIGPAGGASEIGYTVPKDADPVLGELMVKGLADELAVVMPPLPQKPIGQGGYWMVTDRTTAFGVDVVRYRVYTVDKIDNGAAALSVAVRQYAATDTADLGALAGGQKMTLQQFQSKGDSKIDWSPTALMPARAEASQRVGMAGSVSGGQQGGLDTLVSARFAVDAGEKKK